MRSREPLASEGHKRLGLICSRARRSRPNTYTRTDRMTSVRVVPAETMELNVTEQNLDMVRSAWEFIC